MDATYNVHVQMTIAILLMHTKKAFDGIGLKMSQQPKDFFDFFDFWLADIYKVNTFRHDPPSPDLAKY